MISSIVSLALYALARAPIQAPTDADQMAKISFFNGIFQGESSLNAGGTDVKAQTKAQGRLALKGRYYELDLEYAIPGMPTDGKVIITYDSGAKLYKSWWFDSLSAAPIVQTGKFEAGNLVLISEPTAIGGGATTAIVRTTWKPKGSSLAYEVEFKSGETWTSMIKVNLAKAQIQPSVQPRS